MSNLDKCLIFSNLELPHFRLQDMKIKPLIQLREMISKALSAQANLSKSFQSFFIEAMELFLTIPNRINFLQMGRFGRSSEQRFSMNSRKKFDWISFNRTMVQEVNPNRRAIAIDPIYISKSGKKTPSVGYFFSTDIVMNAIDILDVYRTRFHIEFLYRDSKQFTGLCNCQSGDVKEMDFAFNMSLSTINVARQFGKEYDVDLSVSDVKMLLNRECRLMFSI